MDFPSQSYPLAKKFGHSNVESGPTSMLPGDMVGMMTEVDYHNLCEVGPEPRRVTRA